MKKKTTYILELNIYNKNKNNNNNKMNDLNELIQITKDEYLKLVSSQIVLNCLKNSMCKYNEFVANDNKDETLNSIENRKFLNVNRWKCISRPQYKYSCGIRYTNI